MEPGPPHSDGIAARVRNYMIHSQWLRNRFVSSVHKCGNASSVTGFLSAASGMYAIDFTPTSPTFSMHSECGGPGDGANPSRIVNVGQSAGHIHASGAF